MKKIVIAGGTGFLGNALITYFQNNTETIIVLTRGENNIIKNVKYVHWDAKTLGDWKNELDNADVLINMTGKSVDCRYHQKNKDLILSSRINSTKVLGQALQECKYPPKIWFNSSTATIYRHSLIKEMDEIDGEIGKGFSVDVATSWENEFFKTSTPNTRKVALRTSIVLGKNGGALPPILRLTKLGLGGKQGSGNQKISWIHEQDFCRSIEFIINNTNIKGVINVVAPNPITNKQFMKKLRQVLGIAIGIPTPRFILELGARIINTETELILKSRNVIPKKLQNRGFQFMYSDLEKAFYQLNK